MEASPQTPQAVPVPSTEGRSAIARAATILIVAAHLVLLLVALPDVRLTVDAGYHVALSRWYGEHGTAFWDHINFGPGGRPNLQGPAQHLVVGVLGRIIGGSGDDYVLANALVAVGQWAAALWTAIFFARRFGGDWAALCAAALLSGNGVASGSFSVGIPSGWLFILTPWAVHWFIGRRLLLAAAATALSIYAHLGGFAMAPVGVAIAALLMRRWRDLLVVGAVTAVLVSPYLVHVVRHLDWYRGERGHVVLEVSPLIFLIGIAALVAVARSPRRHALLIAWCAAPAIWLIQDYTRFFSQSTLALAAIGGIGVAALLARLTLPWRIAGAAALILLATLQSPINAASLPGELAWARGDRYPRLVDWGEARTLAAVIARANLTHQLVSPYNPTQCIRIAAFTPVQFEKGHWVEVQPADDPAELLPSGGKTFIVPLAADDATMADLVERGWVHVHGGSATTSVVTLTSSPAPIQDVMPVVHRIIADEADWLADHARNNVRAPAGVDRDAWQRLMAEQRIHAGRLYAASVVYAHALERRNPAEARTMRTMTRGFGSLANFLGDEGALGFIDDDGHSRLLANLRRVAGEARKLTVKPAGVRALWVEIVQLFDEYFVAA